ncbi:S10 family serine carboxypeptidase-like protein, partial [Corallococcus sp. AB049A]|uniref:S10 family serine carboxypeptidase-like protein n=1 Tax=Corallococcus sp. AB049A TaxID=2316721 RepID=UPI0018F2A020
LAVAAVDSNDSDAVWLTATDYLTPTTLALAEIGQAPETLKTMPAFFDAKGKVIADVVFTAYTMPGKDRPVTFALNGGPGASSVYLNMGAIGPKVVTFGSEGDSASAPATLHDNPGTWLDFTDLVFIDPVGTGFSRARIGDDEAKKALYNPSADVEY